MSLVDFIYTSAMDEMFVSSQFPDILTSNMMILRERTFEKCLGQEGGAS